jgi:hypothetical protein
MSGARPPSPANPAATIFPSGRDGDAVHLVAVRDEVGDHDRVALEGGIERAIALVAHDRELRIPGVSCGGARDDDVAVSLDREGERGVVSERRADRGRLGRPRRRSPGYARWHSLRTIPEPTPGCGRGDRVDDPAVRRRVVGGSSGSRPRATASCSALIDRWWGNPGPGWTRSGASGSTAPTPGRSSWERTAGSYAPPDRGRPSPALRQHLRDLRGPDAARRPVGPMWRCRRPTRSLAG